MTEDKMGSGRTVASGEGAVGNEGVLEAVAAQARKMFCFQCEQTAGCGGCTSAGVCGKSALTAREQDELTGALVGLARALGDQAPSRRVSDLVLDGLFTCVTNVDFEPAAVRALTDRIHAERDSIASERGVAVADYDMDELWNAPEDVRSLKSLVLFGIRGMAAYAHHAAVLDYRDPKLASFFCRALAGIGSDAGASELLPLLLEVGEQNFSCMALLDGANTGTYGKPVPTRVELGIEPGPFIVVTGHDLRDLEQLLEQTDGRGVNVYTHGEMLPAHAYPLLKAHPQLKGNFGTAWQNQRREFDAIPAPVLFTTNCLMPPRDSYKDRVFTTGVVRFEGCAHVEAAADGRKDFSAVIDKAFELGGYGEFHQQEGMNGGRSVTTGFGHDAVLGVADKVVEAVRAGKLRHIFLVGGCDGAKPGRNYYTDFVRNTPADTIVLTLACGKFRFNDLDLGELGDTGLPRLLDMGQCNDAYSALVVATALAEAFGCGVNDLPLTLVLSWYEQKAVAILLTLLHLGIKGIFLGPTLPAFVSPGVLQTLVDAYGIRPTTTPETDMAAALA